MTNEELALKIASGNESLVGTLWEQIEAYVRWYASHFYFRHEARCRALMADIDDLSQMGYFAMIDAIARYDVSREAKFTTLLNHCMRTHFFRLLNMAHAGWEKNTIYDCRSLSEPISESGELTLGDAISIEDSGLAEVEEKDYQAAVETASSAAFVSLTDRQSEVISALFFEQQTYAVVGQRLGISRGAVQIIKASGFKKLRKDKALCAIHDEG